MEFKFRYLLLILVFFLVAFSQFYYMSPLVPKTEPNEKPKLFSKNNQIENKVQVIKLSDAISEEELRQKHGKLQEILLIDGTLMRGVVIEKNSSIMKVETIKKNYSIPLENIASVDLVK
jgi:hypothetical protein